MSSSVLVNGIRLGDNQKQIIIKLCDGCNIMTYLSISGQRKSILLSSNTSEKTTNQHLYHRDILRLLSKGLIKVSHTGFLNGELIYMYTNTFFCKTILNK